MSSRATGFGAAAHAYERFRPGYPQALVDVILEYAVVPLRTALEIGAGTGKATRLLVANGLSVTATEPDPAMLDVLRTQVPAAHAVEAALEDLPSFAAYDLVIAVASLHWTRPEGRWARVAALLKASGIFACVGGPIRLADRELAGRVRAAHAPYLATDEVPSPGGADSALHWPGTELASSPLFAEVREAVIHQRIEASREDFVGYLSTVSAYLQLPPAVRAAALAAIEGVLPDRVDLRADLTVHLARARLS